MNKPRPRITTATQLVHWIRRAGSTVRTAVREVELFVARQSARKQRTASGGAR